MRFEELSVVQKELLLDVAKTSFVIVELRGTINKDISCFIENKKGEVFKKVHKRTLYSLINRGLLYSVSHPDRIIYSLNSKALQLVGNRKREKLKNDSNSVNSELIELKNTLVKNGFSIFEKKKLDERYLTEFNILSNLKNKGNVLVCLYRYENYKNKHFHLIIVEDSNGYHVGSKDTYNRVLEPYSKIKDIKDLKSYIRIVLDILMESEMDLEIDF